jgi:hypothetical protein
MIERRRHQRNDLMAGVQYSSSPDTFRTSRGIIRNYSSSGICLIATKPLVEGQEIVVINLAVSSSKKAIVRWGQKISNDSYNIGLEYIKRPIVDPGLYSQGNTDTEALDG